ncbi:T9SS type A sorting domain-containing protein [Echinicola vietnamensis]|uniref:Secretion system C-terminal sorting domain-containing protein n=1 Tax=Echinicola vietnamensis (strain DSM 17526 / LMG 23754 / KMM 6221) TaxID=926556 RepID=L0G010_ECHVK|nr:T9SS type A sorting domain-containing protein [Echinicola vietnamensis]AGA78215.1 hypothetical protein Echvi_1961 [Echinicola vietnamensis DSM 17526]
MYRFLNILFFLVSLFLSSYASVAQVPEVDWVKTFGGSDYEMIWESKVDYRGNTVNVGLFSDTVDFDPGPGSNIRIVPPGVSHMFVQKLDANGNLLWVKTLSSPEFVTSNNVSIQKDNSIVVNGVFAYDSIDFDPSPSNSYYLKGSSTMNSSYILKLDDQGNFIWAIVHSGSVIMNSLISDTLDNIYSIGNFSDSFDGNPDPSVYTPITPHTPGKSDFFVQKLNSAGRQLWGKTIKGSKDIISNGIALNQKQELIIVGSFKGSADFNPGSGVSNITAGGNNFSGFILQLDTAGAYKDAFVINAAASSSCKIVDIETDDINNIYLAGSYRGNDVDFDPGQDTASSPVYQGWFIEKLDSNGSLEWAHPYGSNLLLEQTRSLRLLLDDYKNVYVGGYFDDGDLELEPGIPGGKTLNHNGSRDIFIAKHDSHGKIEWAQGFGSNRNDRALSINKDSDGSIYLSGYYSEAINFNLYDPNDITLNRGGYDCFVLKFKSCPTLPTEVILDPNTAILTWDYKDAYSASYHLSWYSCDGDSLISDETDTTFSPTQNGNYALIIEKEGCIDTSECLSIQNVSLKDGAPLQGIKLFPNPTGNILHVAGLNEPAASFIVMDILGHKVLETYNQDLIDLGELKSGTYFVLIEVDGLTTVKKVFKN